MESGLIESRPVVLGAQKPGHSSHRVFCSWSPSLGIHEAPGPQATS